MPLKPRKWNSCNKKRQYRNFTHQYEDSFLLYTNRNKSKQGLKNITIKSSTNLLTYFFLFLKNLKLKLKIVWTFHAKIE